MTCLLLADASSSSTSIRHRVQDSHHHLAQSRLANVALLVGAAVTYFAVRHLTRSKAHVADANARSVQSFEARLGIHREHQIQHLTLSHPWIMTAADDVYIYGHWPVIVAVLAWLLLRHHEQFVLARDALLLSGGAALIVFAFFPVAPPRLADPTIIDTVTQHAHAYRVLQPPAFTDAYAAMPSLHCGWDLLVALTLARTLAARWLRVVVRLAPLLMVAAVFITGNHYIVDAIAGDVLAGASLYACEQVRNRRWLRPPIARTTRPASALRGVAPRLHRQWHLGHGPTT